MPRRWAILGLSLILFAGCAADPVTKDNFAKIHQGMTRQDVEAILGPAHQSYQGSILSWKGSHEQRVITVILDDHGQVSEINASGL